MSLTNILQSGLKFKTDCAGKADFVYYDNFYVNIIMLTEQTNRVCGVNAHRENQDIEATAYFDTIYCSARSLAEIHKQVNATYLFVKNVQINEQRFFCVF